MGKRDKRRRRKKKQAKHEANSKVGVEPKTQSPDIDSRTATTTVQTPVKPKKP